MEVSDIHELQQNVKPERIYHNLVTDNIIQTNDERYSFSTAVPPWEFMVDRSEGLKTATTTTTLKGPTHRLNTLISEIDTLLNEFKVFITSTCSPSSDYDNCYQKPNKMDVVGQHQYVQLTKNIALVLGIEEFGTKLIVVDSDKITSEYKRCSSMVDTLVGMLSYKDFHEVFVENNSNENCGNPEITNGCEDEYFPQSNLEAKKQQATIKTKTGSVTRLVPRNSKRFTGIKRRRPFGYYPDFTISKQTYAEIIIGGPPFTCPSCEKRFKRRSNFEEHLYGKCLGIVVDIGKLKPKYQEDNGKFYCLQDECQIIAKSKTNLQVLDYSYRFPPAYYINK